VTAAGGEGVRDSRALWGRGELSSASSEGSSAQDYETNSLVNNDTNSLVNNDTNADQRGLGMVEMRVVRS